MLKSNSKYTKEKIKEYIKDSFNLGEYEDIPETTTHAERCKFILKHFISEKLSNDPSRRAYLLRGWYKNSYFEAFKDWLQGLPSILDAGYYYNIEAKPIIKEWLQETDQEAEKYTEQEAEELITRLLYREIFRYFEI